VATKTVHLDKKADSAAFVADPDAALARQPEPVLLDEWNEVPEVLGAVKRAVDYNTTPGRFLLTGSVRLGTEYTWPATGRIIRLPILGLTQRELAGRTEGELFVDRISQTTATVADLPTLDLDLFDYLEMAAAGGFPETAVRLHTHRTRSVWFASYLNELATNDVKLVGKDPDPNRFRPYLQAVAAYSGMVVDLTTLLDATHIKRNTANSYDKLLGALFFQDLVPAWYSNRLTSLTALPKRFLYDSGLLMHMLGVDPDSAAADPRILGAVLETFVASQIRAEIPMSKNQPELFHLRDKGGRHEVDLVLQYPRSRIIGIEVKATASPSIEDARHLVWLRDRLGDSFIGGLVLTTGKQAFQLADRIHAAPISSLWAKTV
jgi:predicted AAA+ superfamily ATPase